MEFITPIVGTKGAFAAKPPFTLRPNTIYTCEAVRTLEEMYKEGIDVKARIYDPVSLGDTALFEAERIKKPKIVTLRSDDGFYAYIPNNYLNGVPDVETVPYHRVVLSVDMGMLPDNMDLGLILDQFSEFASLFLGVNATVRRHVIGIDQNPTKAQHEQLENVRKGALASYKTFAQQVKDLEVKLAAEKAKVKQLSQTVNKRT